MEALEEQASEQNHFWWQACPPHNHKEQKMRPLFVYRFRKSLQQLAMWALKPGRSLAASVMGLAAEDKGSEAPDPRSSVHRPCVNKKTGDPARPRGAQAEVGKDVPQEIEVMELLGLPVGMGRGWALTRQASRSPSR